MTQITCRLTAKNWDQLRNPTLGNQVYLLNVLLLCRGITEARVAYLSVLSLLSVSIFPYRHHHHPSAAHHSTAAYHSTAPASAAHLHTDENFHRELQQTAADEAGTKVSQCAEVGTTELGEAAWRDEDGTQPSQLSRPYGAATKPAVLSRHSAAGTQVAKISCCEAGTQSAVAPHPTEAGAKLCIASRHHEAGTQLEASLCNEAGTKPFVASCHNKAGTQPDEASLCNEAGTMSSCRWHSVHISCLLLMLLLARPHNCPLIALMSLQQRCCRSLVTHLCRHDNLSPVGATLIYLGMANAAFFYQVTAITTTCSLTK